MHMRKLTTLVFALSAFLLLGTVDSVAQNGRGKGQGQGRAVGRQDDRGPSANQGRGKAADRQADRQKDRGDDRRDRADLDRGRRDRVVENIERNPRLAERLQDLLPRGTNLTDAARGFKNQGQFIAALHVSRNLDIPFRDLKAKMTGSNPMSLGRAIQELRPEMGEERSKDEAKRAERDAKRTEAEAKTRRPIS
jgi:hypothetical protein